MFPRQSAKVLPQETYEQVCQNLLDLELAMALLSKELTQLGDSSGGITRRLRELRQLVWEQELVI